MFEDRIQQLDWRLTRTFQLRGTGRLRGNFDIYNLFNASTILEREHELRGDVAGARPRDGRTSVKVSAQFDF